MTDLEQVDPGFSEDLIQSKPSVDAVADHIRKNTDMAVVVPPIRCRPNVKDRAKYRDAGDIIVGGQYRVEVRQDLKGEWTTRYPWATVIVCNCNLFDFADPKPIVYYRCNKALSHAVKIGVNETYDEWTKDETNHHGRRQEIYRVARELVEIVEL